MPKKRLEKLAETDGLRERLDGGSCLNQRSILLACEIFSGKPPAAVELKLADLLEALWVLELIIVSKNLSYDGTLPEKDLSDLERETVALLEGTQRSEGFFGAIKPRNEKEQLGFVKGAALKALDDLGVLPQSSVSVKPSSSVLPGLDKPLDADSTRIFFEKLSQLSQASASKKSRVTSQDELVSLLNSRFRGSKCLAGIAALGNEALECTIKIPKLCNISPEVAAGILINRFRFTYVRQLSFGAHNLYVPAGRWKQLSEIHAITFAEAVRKHFQQTYATVITEEINERMANEFGEKKHNSTISLPPIGLYVLMKANPRLGAKGVIESALDTFEEYGQLFRQFWKKTREITPPDNGWIIMTGNNKLDRISESIEGFLNDELGKLERLALNVNHRNGSVLEQYITPIVKAGSTIGGSVIGTVAGAETTIGPVLGAAIGGAAGWAIEHCFASVRGRLVGHIDEYRALDAALLRSYSGQIRLDKLEQKVFQVLKRKLI